MEIGGARLGVKATNERVSRLASVSLTFTSVKPPPARRSASSVFPTCAVVLGGREEFSDTELLLLRQPHSFGPRIGN